MTGTPDLYCATHGVTLGGTDEPTIDAHYNEPGNGGGCILIACTTYPPT